MLVVGRTPVWEMPEFVALNRLPMRVPLTPYPTAAAARAGGESPWQLSLDGTWRFRLVDSPLAAPEDFAALDYDDSSWGDRSRCRALGTRRATTVRTTRTS